MKKTSFLCIICAVVFGQFVFSADLEICFNSEINKYYEKFNKKNGLEKQFVYIDFYPDGLIKDIVNKTSVIDAYYNNNQTINRENDMIKIIFNSNFIISIKLEDDYIIVTKDYFGKPCGRTAGRITGSSFVLNNVVYHIENDLPYDVLHLKKFIL